MLDLKDVLKDSRKKGGLKGYYQEGNTSTFREFNVLGIRKTPNESLDSMGVIECLLEGHGLAFGHLILRNMDVDYIHDPMYMVVIYDLEDDFEVSKDPFFATTSNRELLDSYKEEVIF